MATGSPDVVLSLGVDSTSYTAGLRAATDDAARAGRSIGAGFSPANQAVKSFGDTVRSYRTEQTQQARTVNFLVRELTDVTGMSKEAAGAVGGLGQVMLEAASGGGAFAIGFEAAKFVIGQVVAGFKAAEERANELAKAGVLAASAITNGMDALAKATASAGTAGQKAFGEVFAAATKESNALSESIEKLRPTRWSQISAFIWDGAKGIQRVNHEFAQASAKLGKMVEDAKLFATAAGDAAGGYEESPEQDAAYWKIKADDYAKSREKAAKAAADEAKEQARISALIGTTMDRMGDAAAADRGNFPDMFYNDATAKQMNMGGAADPFAAVLGPGNNEGAAKFTEDVKKLNDEARQTSSIMGSIGDSIGSAFGSIGSIVGNAAGQFLKIVGQMIQQAVQLAVALSASAMAWTTPLGAVAIGAATLAGLLGLISSVPSFDVGTMSVPSTGLALVHRGEAILPAGGPAESYRAGLARTGGATTVNVHMNISALDGQSVYRTMTASRDQVARVIREAVRDGVMG